MHFSFPIQFSVPDITFGPNGTARGKCNSSFEMQGFVRKLTNQPTDQATVRVLRVCVCLKYVVCLPCVCNVCVVSVRMCVNEYEVCVIVKCVKGVFRV